jgi:hypothetical protein
MQHCSSKRLCEIKNDFERGVFIALYNSRKQQRYRITAGVVLGLKHVLRGLLFSWPLYFLALAAYMIPGLSALITILLLLPALYVSWVILSRGVKDDYHELVEGYLLRPGYPQRMLFHKKQ